MPTKKWRDENVEKLREYRRKWYHKNKKREQQKSRIRNSKRRKRITQLYNEYKNTLSCKMCGETDSVCLDFHHLDSNNKKFDISIGFLSRSMDVVLEEINKCIVLCANCHRKVHAKK